LTARSGKLLTASSCHDLCHAAVFAPPAAAAVAAASPAIFASYRDAVAADAQAFASPAEFADNNVLAPASVARLRGVPAWVACGGTDPFEAASELLRSRVSRLAGAPPAGGIESGCHDEAFWARTAPSGLAFLGLHLGPADGPGAATGYAKPATAG
jgi:hypothetical protein